MPIWAKRDESGNELPLEDHMLDVAAVFEKLIEAPGYGRALYCAAGRELTESDRARLCVLAALHDIGKVNARFQQGLGGHLLDGVVLCGLAPEFRFLWTWGDQATIFQALCATFSHHGNIVWEGNAAIMRQAHRDLLQEISLEGRAEFAKNGERLLAKFPAANTGAPLPDNPAFWHLFAGLLTLADQVGSSTESFPIVRDSSFIRAAGEAINDRGLDTSATFPQTSLPPAEIFGWPEGSTASPMQQATAELPLEDRLILVESETGSGKTEAALLRYRRLAEAGAVSGLYFAIPTRSSAVQIQSRVNAAAKRLWGCEAALAVPGYMTSGEARGFRLSAFDVGWSDTGKPELSRWAVDAPRKYLAAPIAVGTVDQALQSVLKRKWAHMRGSALARSLLVIDEVHASDAYMTELMIRTLRDHLALGGHALLMSATLTTERRCQIFEACGAAPGPRAPGPYPLITSLRGENQVCQPIASAGFAKNIQMHLTPDMTEPDRIADMAAAQAAAGGRVLIVRNSIRGALAVMRALETRHPDAPLFRVAGQRTVHHGRFAPEDRKALDAAVEGALGKHSTEPVIVIGTQTLEQSLDIDADVLITDICPIDVLLQRLGRLHRHARDTRPAPFAAPACVVLHAPDASSAELRSHQIGIDRAYPEDFMIREVEAMVTEIPEWRIPEMNRMLVDRGARDDLLHEDEGQAAAGRARSMRGLARRAMLDRAAPIQDQGDFSNLHGSRLGDMPVTVALDPPIPSPFGAGRIKMMPIPNWMLGGTDHDPDLPRGLVNQGPGETYEISVHGVRLTYGRLGLEKSRR